MKRLIYIALVVVLPVSVWAQGTSENPQVFEVTWIDEYPLIEGGISPYVEPEDFQTYLESHNVNLALIETVLLLTSDVIFQDVSQGDSAKMSKEAAGNFWKKVHTGDLGYDVLPEGSRFLVVGYRYPSRNIDYLKWLKAGFDIPVLVAEVEVQRPDGTFQIVRLGFMVPCGNLVVVSVSEPFPKEEEKKITRTPARPEVEEREGTGYHPAPFPARVSVQ